MTLNKREKILKAAVKVFARDGFYKAKMEEIAKQAGVATGTTYLYFENKDGLLIAIFEEEMIPIIESSKKNVAQEEKPDRKIFAFIKNHFELVRDNPDMAFLLQVELRLSSKFIHGYKGTKFKEYLDILGDIFQEGQKGGEFRGEIQSTLFKQIVFGAIDQIATNWALSKTKKIDIVKSADQVYKVIIDGIACR